MSEGEDGSDDTKHQRQTHHGSDEHFSILSDFAGDWRGADDTRAILCVREILQWQRRSLHRRHKSTQINQREVPIARCKCLRDIYVSDSMRSIQLTKYANAAACAWAFDKIRNNSTTNFLLYVILGQAILGGIHAPELANRNPTIAFNLIFQFLFFELRNANKVRKWFHRKLSLELDELISKTTTGKLFDKLSVRVLKHLKV